MPAGIFLMLLKSAGLLFDSASFTRHRYGHRLHHLLAYYGLIWLVLAGLALWVVVMIARRAAVKWRCNACHGTFRARHGETVLCPHCQARITLPQRSRVSIRVALRHREGAMPTLGPRTNTAVADEHAVERAGLEAR
jgi:hypothetical protein